MNNAYVEEAQRKRRGGPGAEHLSKLPSQKCSRPVLLSASVDIMEQKNLKKVRDEGGAVSARIGSRKMHFVDLQ